MDFTPGSYKTSSPHASSAGFLKPSLGPTSYPTPPQTHGHTEFSPIPTTSIRGLGIQNCDVEPISAQFPICGPPQPLAQVSQCWTHDTPSSGGFLNPSPNLGAYYGIPFYDDMDVLSTHENSPFAPTTSHANTPDQFAFLSPHQQQSRMGNPVVQGDPVLSGYDMNLRTAPVPRQQQRTVKYSLPNCSTALPTDRGALKRPIAQVDAVPYQASPPSAPSYINHNTGDTLLELNPNVERPAVHGRAQRSPLRSSNVNTQVESITSDPRDDQPVKRQKRRSTTVAKYKCGKCDKDFTRNSNCKSHMKTHDPDRYYPHKCGYGQCTKKFSRKTDLERHVDSVSSLYAPTRCVHYKLTETFRFIKS